MKKNQRISAKNSTYPCGLMKRSAVLFSSKNKIGILFVLGAYLLFHTQARAQQIVIDVSRNQPIYLHDDGYAASSAFAKYLDKKFYQLSVNQLPLDVFLKDNHPSILVLTPTIFQFHTNEEVIAVQDYVKEGGNLLIFAEHENFFRSSENSNRFLEGSGIRINYDKAEQTKFNHFAEQFRVRAINPFVEKDSVIFFFPATLELKDSTFSKAQTEDGKHLAAIAPVGNGKMAVVADFEIVWNMTEKTGFHYGKNDEFIFGIINSLFKDAWLSYHGTTKFLDPKKKNIWLNSECIESNFAKLINYSPLINELKKKGYGMMFWDMQYDFKNNMQPKENDIYIGLCACESKNEMNSILKFNRIFLAGYNKTDFWKNITDKFSYFQSGGYDTKHMEDAVSSLWAYDSYTPISWQDSLERKLGVTVSRKISFIDSIHKSKVTYIYSDGGNFVDRVSSTVSAPTNIVEDKVGRAIPLMPTAFSNSGTYYPAPFENNILLTAADKKDVPQEDIILALPKPGIVVSGASAIWRSDFPDKKFQKQIIEDVIKELTR